MRNQYNWRFVVASAYEAARFVVASAYEAARVYQQLTGDGSLQGAASITCTILGAAYLMCGEL